MFDIGWDEMAVVAVVALVVIGPKDLPVVLRQIGRWTRKARLMAGEFQRSIDDMVRENDLDQLKSQVEKATDPNALRREIEKTIDPSGEIARSLEPPVLPAADSPPDMPTPELDSPVADDTAQPVSLDVPVKPPQP